MPLSIIFDTKEAGGKVTRVIVSYIVVCFLPRAKTYHKMLEKRKIPEPAGNYRGLHGAGSFLKNFVPLGI